MKKFVLLVLLFTVIASVAMAEGKEKFVNPLFYKTMKPVSRGAWRTKITPTEMISDNKGTVLKQKCTLVENTMEAVMLQCESAYDKTYIKQYRFVLAPEEKIHSGLVVFLYGKNLIEKGFLSRETLSIPYKG